MARRAFREAARELDCAIAIVSRDANLSARFQAAGLHWVRGLLLLAEGNVEAAVASFRRELEHEAGGHIYASECAAQAWYCIGAAHLPSDEDVARDGFGETIRRMPGHAQAHLGLSILDARREGGSVAARLDARLLAVASAHPIDPAATELQIPAHVPFEVHMARAGALKADGDTAGCLRMLQTALDAAPPGSSGWTIPLDPLLGVLDHPDLSAALLGTLADRAW